MTLKKFLAVTAAVVSTVSGFETVETLATSASTTIHRIYGDVNEDGKINAIDASLILKTYADASVNDNFEPSPEMDLNWDEKVNSIDASYALALYVDASTGNLLRYMDTTGVYVFAEEGMFLSEIASSEEMSLDGILQINPQITNPDLIFPEDKIYVRVRPEFTGEITSTATTTTTTMTTTTATTTSTTSSTTTTSTMTTTTSTATTTTTTPTVITPVSKKYISKGIPQNIRESRTTQSKCIGKLYFNDTYEMIGEENGWEEIRINDIHGYIYTKEYPENFVSATTKIDTDCISNAISKAERQNPGINIGVGVYTLNGNTIFEYNQNTDIAAGCTVKAPYECFVLEQCQEDGIDINAYQLQYQYGMKNNGSGTLKEEPYGGWYSIRNLSNLTIQISDNTAYNVLLSKFGLADFCQFQYEISGETDWLQYDYPKVTQRKKEWLHIWDFLKTETEYANYFYNLLNSAAYSYLTPNMQLYHSVLHKSGWQEEDVPPYVYPCAADCAILDEKYLLVVLTEDYNTGKAHTEVVGSIGAAIEELLYF